MTKIEIGTRVKVDGQANQYPFERIVDEGIVLDNAKGYLVQLKKGRENLIFKRYDLTPILKFSGKLYWEMCADVDIEAVNKKNATLRVLYGPLPSSDLWQYVPDSKNFHEELDIKPINP